MERLSLLAAIPYLRAYAGQIFVIKAGGELLQREDWREGLARDVGVLHRLGVGVVLVHGGGPQLDATAERLGIDATRVAGRRITSPELLDAAIMEWRGRLSAAWVSALARAGERAVGVSGFDAGTLQAVRRPPAVMIDDNGARKTVDFGCVGDVRHVDTQLVSAILAMPAVPVISPLAAGADGEILNVNADTVAAELAVALGAAKLLLLTQAPGIMKDPEDPQSVLHWTDLRELGQLEETGMLRGGMRPKLGAIRRALAGGVPRVHVVDGRRTGALLEEVFTTAGSGTLVVTEADQAPAELVDDTKA